MRQNEVWFSNREVEIMARTANLQSAQEIANAIYVSRRTVEFHLANVYAKLALSGAKAKAFAIRAYENGEIKAKPVKVTA